MTSPNSAHFFGPCLAEEAVPDCLMMRLQNLDSQHNRLLDGPARVARFHPIKKTPKTDETRLVRRLTVRTSEIGFGIGSLSVYMAQKRMIFRGGEIMSKSCVMRFNV
jgi:hypothetical protein